MYSVGMAVFFVLVVAVANLVLGFAVAAKLGLGPTNWDSICAALRPDSYDEDPFSRLENADQPGDANHDSGEFPA